MPQSLPSSSQILSEDKFPTCVSIKLEGKLVQAEKPGIFNLKRQSAATDQIQLYLTLQFKEQDQALPLGRLKFGLTGGELNLRVENGIIAQATPGVNQALELSRQTGRQNQECRDSESCVTVSFQEKKPTSKGSLGTQKIAEKAEKNPLSISQVSTPSSPKNLTWAVLGEPNNSILQGSLPPTFLGTLKVTAKPCRVEAFFSISPQDIRITDTTGLLPHTLGKKKKVVLERALVRRLLKQKFKPYLSRYELRYE
ncbi:MAG TPA: hypothetical protein V6D26_32105 [Stenomitos sp.]